MRLPASFRLSSVYLLATLPAIGGEMVIVQKNREFSKAEVTIKAGDKIVFKNADDFSHSLYTLTAGSDFGFHMQPAGESLPIAFPAEGPVEIHCALHPKMKLVVNVKK